MKWCLAPPKQSGEIPDIDPVADEIAPGTDLISKDSHTTRDPESKRIQTPECRLPVMKPRSTSISLQPALPVRGALVRRSWCTAAGSLDSPPVHPLSSPVRLPSCTSTSTKRPPCISTSTTPEDRIAWALPKRFSYQRRMAAPLGSQRTLRSDNNAAAQTQARVLRNIFLLGLMPNFDEKAWTDFPSSKQTSGVLFWGQLPRTCSIHEPLLAAIMFCQSVQNPSRSLNRDECANPCQTSGEMHGRLQGRVRSTSDAFHGWRWCQKEPSALHLRITLIGHYVDGPS